MSLLKNMKTRSIRKQKKVRVRTAAIIRKAEMFGSVLVVSTSENETLVRMAQDIFCNAEVSLLYPRLKKEDNSRQFRYSVHPSDFSLTGTLKNDKLIKLFHRKFDLIVDLSNDSELLHFFLDGVDADLIIGSLENPAVTHHDLLLQSGSGDDEFLRTIEKQLNHLYHGHQKI